MNKHSTDNFTKNETYLNILRRARVFVPSVERSVESGIRSGHDGRRSEEEWEEEERSKVGQSHDDKLCDRLEKSKDI